MRVGEQEQAIVFEGQRIVNEGLMRALDRVISHGFAHRYDLGAGWSLRRCGHSQIRHPSATDDRRGPPEAPAMTRAYSRSCAAIICVRLKRWMARARQRARSNRSTGPPGRMISAISSAESTM